MFLFHRWSSKFATGRNVLKITKELSKLDSEYLDKNCQSILRNCDHQGLKNKDLEKIIGTSNFNPIQNLAQSILYLYHSASSAKVGLLKGDIHSNFAYKFSQYLETKSQIQLSKQLIPQQYKSILNMITESRQFRLPTNGIEDSLLQDKNNLYQRQLLLEIVSNQQSQNQYDNVLDSLIKIGKVHLSEKLKKYMIEWFEPLCQAIKDEQSRCREQKLNETRSIYAEYFVKLSADKIASVALSQLMKQITYILFKDPKELLFYSEETKQNDFEHYDSIKYNKLCVTLAKWVNTQLMYEKKERNFKMVMKCYDDLHSQIKKEEREEERNRKSVRNAKDEEGDQQRQRQRQRQRENRLQQLNKKIEQLQKQHKIKFIRLEQRKQYLLLQINNMIKFPHKYQNEIPVEVQYHIGATLIYLMKEILKIKNRSNYRIPLLTFQHSYIKRNQKLQTVKMLKINDNFLNAILPEIEKEGDLFMHLQRSVPTIIESMPWVEYQIGGYYLQPTTIMRFSHCKMQQKIVKYSDISRVFKVLNYLGSIPWKINRKVLNIVEALWEEGGEKGEIPKRYSEMASLYITKLKSEVNYKKKQELSRMIQKIRDQHSLRSDFNLKLNMARSFSRLDRFYYPHNLDFRGRVYPVPPHLNHIGNDLSRGLLKFAEGRKLGESGLRWLKIHCANLMGMDKATLQEKLQYTQANLDLIRAIAQNPLKNRQWLSYEDCWQALGAIFELDQALRSPNHEQFISDLHIHQDGSCNGLQHYAALGRDMEGAYQVNLGPTERPGDVYTHVAKMVIKMINADIEDPESKNYQIAKKVSGHIKRKTIKQTVMTSVYGVTFIGARQQIYRQIRDQNFLQNENDAYLASIYIAKCTLAAISNLFSKAHQIKKWLINCAKIITDTDNPVGWITPMGLPVVQPYRQETKLNTIHTIVNRLKLSKTSEHLPVNKNKQRSAFPPNFVHSLDSTHMMYTTENCMKLGVTFAAVHDSYWTHAGTVDKMNTILRDEFIRLHSEPLLENLKRSFEMRYPELKFQDIPERGEFNLDNIKKSLYFFS